MKERPILFSAPLVRAILAGKKTQTRRIVKPAPVMHDFHNGRGPVPALKGRYVQRGVEAVGCDVSRGLMAYVRCPYGSPGDRLWVRETWQTLHHNGVRTVYRADGEDPRTGWDDVPPSQRPPMTWRPSIFLPRWASRITLEVTGVRVERLQAITEDDAKAEGVETSMPGKLTIDGKSSASTIHTFGPDAHVKSFALLWNAINGERATWADNPFVWVVSFRRIKP